MASQLSIKIQFGAVTKTMAFFGDKVIAECLREIREKLGEQAGAGADHGLFWPEHLKWLVPNKTLDFYDLKSGDLLEYKKKHRPLRVKLMDGALKTILIDESLTVVSLVEAVCQKIGISNPEEYSFVLENTQGLTLNNQLPSPKTLRRGEKALKSGNGDDEPRWLNPEKCLREQGITESETLLLKKKFFFSDQNIDRNDPIQLNLLYVQARDGIISGEHPCTDDEACQFAAMQLQVQFDNHDGDKHKPGFTPMKDFLPVELHKRKDIEKRIYQEHRKLQGMSELNAKYRYVQLCRSLKTYGVTFFEVKEKMPKKSKLVPRLLGVTRESVMRVDAETKEIMKVWPLTTLRRWAATPNSFTLDFGDYADAYYSVQTDQGEEISQLIAGYIDIILKKRKEADRVIEDEVEEVAITEENIQSAHATAISMASTRTGQAIEVNVPTTGFIYESANLSSMSMGNARQQAQYMSIGRSGASSIVSSGTAGSQSVVIQQPVEAQTALLQNIYAGFATVNAATTDLCTATVLPPVGTDAASVLWKKQTLEVNKQTIVSQLAAHLAATCSIINQTSVEPDRIHYGTLTSSIATVTTNMAQLTPSVKMLAALEEDAVEREVWMETARHLTLSTAKLLAATQPAIQGHGSRQEILAAGSGIGQAARVLVTKCGENALSEKAAQELNTLTKQIHTCTQDLVAACKGLAMRALDSKGQQEILNLGKKLQQATTQLVACTTIVSPTLNAMNCQEQMAEAAVLVKDLITTITSKADLCRDRAVGDEVHRQALPLHDALAQLLVRASNLEEEQEEKDPLRSEMDRYYDEVTESAAEMKQQSLHDAAATVALAKTVTVASSQLVQTLKSKAIEMTDPNDKNRLMLAAKQVNESATHMVMMTKEYARAPSDTEKQHQLHEAIDQLVQATNVAADVSMKRKLFRQLLLTTRALSASTTQLVSTSRAIAPSNRNQASQMQLNHAAKKANEALSHLVVAIRSFDADQIQSQWKLLHSAGQVLAPCEALMTSAKHAAPFVGDSAAQSQLNQVCGEVGEELQRVRQVFDQAQNMSANLEMESAFETIRNVKRHVVDTLGNVGEGKENSAASPVSPLFDPVATIHLTSKTLTSSMAQLISAALQQNSKYTGVAARDTAMTVQTLNQAVMQYHHAQPNLPLIQETLLPLVDHALALVSMAKQAADQPPTEEDKVAMTTLAKQISAALSSLLAQLPGQQDLDDMIAELSGRQIQPLTAGNASNAEATEQLIDAQKQVNAATAAFQTAMHHVARGQAQPKQLTAAYDQLLNASQQFVQHSSNDNSAALLSSHLSNITSNALQLLTTAKVSAMDPNDVSQRQLMAIHSKHVGDAVVQFLNVCTTAPVPGWEECNSAEQNLQLALTRLQSANQHPALENKDSYHASLQKLALQAKPLLQSLQVISSAKDGSTTATALVALSTSLQQMTEALRRNLYLLTLADPQSVAAVAGIINHEQIVLLSQQIQSSCHVIADETTSESEMLASASQLAKQTAQLCQSCKSASQSLDVTLHPVAKQQFMQYAKRIAACTSQMVGFMKNKDRAGCQQASAPMIETLHELENYAAAPEFKPTEAVVSPMVQAIQKPMTEEMQSMLDSAMALVHSLRAILGNSTDGADEHVNLLNQGKQITEALQRLLPAVKGAAPGQRPCEDALTSLAQVLTELDGWLVDGQVHGLDALKRELGLGGNPSSSSIDSMKRQLMDQSRALQSLVQVLCDASRNDPVGLGASADQCIQLLPNMSANAVKLCCCEAVFFPAALESMKQVANQWQSLLWTAKSMGGDSNASSTLAGTLETQQKDCTSAVVQLIQVLEGAGTSSGGAEQAEFQQAVEAIQIALSEKSTTSTSAGVVSVATVQALAKSMLESVSSASSDSTSLPSLAQRLGDTFTQLSQLISSIPDDNDAASNETTLKDALRKLGGSCLPLLESLKTFNRSMTPIHKQRMNAAVRETSLCIAQLVTAAQHSQRGLNECQQSLEVMQESVRDLEAMLIFADAGLSTNDTTNNSVAGTSSATSIAEEAKNWLTSIKKVCTASTLQSLGQVAQETSQQGVALVQNMKQVLSSMALSDRDRQKELLHQVQEMCQQTVQLLTASMDRQTGNNKDKDNTATMTSAAKSLVTTVNQLVQSIQSMDDASSRLTRSLDHACFDMELLMQQLDGEASTQAVTFLSAEEVVHCARQLASNAQHWVSAANTSDKAKPGSPSQAGDGLVHATIALRKSVEDVIHAVKLCDTPDSDHALAAQTKECIESVIQLIKGFTNHSTPLATSARQVAQHVQQLSQKATELQEKLEQEDNSSTSLATERALVAVAASIEQAANALQKKVEESKEKTQTKENGEMFNSADAAFMQVAKGIADASSALVRCATHVQRSLAASRKADSSQDGQKHHYFDDGTWSQGLVSAARAVADATLDLCHSTHEATQGRTEHERVLASARHVSACTVQLLTAASVQQQSENPMQVRLRAAGKSVQHATESLVRLVSEQQEAETVESSVAKPSAQGKTASRVAEMEAQMNMLQLEKQLEKARQRLAGIRKNRYE